jgi:CheY-like chemotaxis protein
LNLCLNARDAMPDGGRLHLAMDNIVVDESFVAMEIQARPGPYVVLTVADTGMGIPDDIKERIFDPFFTTKGPDRGTGLGLATVLGIVRSHNGFIRLTSRVGEGSQFKIYLPASDIVDTAGQAAQQTAAAPRGNGELILLVDDEEAVRATSRRALTKFGYRVVEAADGTEAVSRFVQQAEAVRLVITDLQMPYMGGVALIHAVRKIRPDITVLAATGYGSKETLRELEALGIAGVMNKPYSARELLEAVQKVLLGEPLK